MRGNNEVLIYIPVVLFTMLFIVMSGKMEKHIDGEHYVVHVSRRFFIFGCVSTLIGCGLALWVFIGGEAVEAWLLASVLAVFWLPGIGFILFYVNRKIIVIRDDVIYQNIWGRRKQFKIRDLRMSPENTALTHLSPRLREFVVTTKDGKKAFQFEENMVNASHFTAQLKKMHMERLEQAMKGK